MTSSQIDNDAGADDVVGAVDFPAFVNDLIRGVFDAIVDASIKQMEAFAGLLTSAATAVDKIAAQARRSGEACGPRHSG